MKSFLIKTCFDNYNIGRKNGRNTGIIDKCKDLFPVLQKHFIAIIVLLCLSS
jgi:hypothetical protein